MTRFPRPVSAKAVRWGLACVILLIGVVTLPRWWSPLRAWVTATSTHFRGADGKTSAQRDDDHDHSGHDHAGHSDATSIELSPQALRNLGLTREYIRPITRSTYRRTITVPAVIAERPGRTHLQVSAPMTSIVTRVYAVSGEAVRPGQLLFEMRLTHEDLVASQTEFLKTLGSLDIEQRELQRLQTLPEGAIAGKLLLDRQYEVQRLESRLAAEREALLLHGLNSEQVQRIEKDRKLLRSIQVFAPVPGDDDAQDFRLSQMFGQVTNTPTPSEAARPTPPATPRGQAAAGNDLILEDLRVYQGQAVAAGETLCVLAEYSHLYIEGQAFERDAQSVVLARERGWPLSALFEGGTRETLVDGLQMAFVSNAIDVESRTLHFYVDLPNERLPVAHREGEPRFISWKYRPGQRLKLLVPVEEWPDEFVVPVDAVAREGAESFVFLQNGNHFDRSPVHVKYRDQLHAVIANDGSVFEGDLIAWRGAHQLQMALKNKSGGGADPHAGHNH